MPTLLVTGASGFLGWYVGEVAAPHWTIYGTYRSHSLVHPAVNGIDLDLTDTDALNRVLNAIRPDAVIHTAAQSKPNQCETDPTTAYAINVTASMRIAEWCAGAGVPCVFTSTDMVFDGRNPPYGETDPVSPINRYGEQKVLAEQAMLERYPATVVCRMPLMFGAAPTAPSFIQPFIERLRSHQELSLFTDEIRTPVSGRTAATGLLLAIAHPGAGILHLGGPERISRYQFGQLMADVLELPTDTIRACRQADVPMAAARPPDVSLDSSRAFALGYQPLSLREELRQLKF